VTADACLFLYKVFLKKLFLKFFYFYLLLKNLINKKYFLDEKKLFDF
jgi:hypothetical protein